jgi:hypothetical protein
MFRLSESDYRRLEPLAVKVYKRSARSAHVAKLLESKIGRRALVDMMFLEGEPVRAYGNVDFGTEFDNSAEIGQRMAKNNYLATENKLSMIFEAAEDSANSQDGIEKLPTGELPKTRIATPAQATKFLDKVKNFFLKIVKWTGEKSKNIFKKVYSFFFKESKLKSPRWLHIALTVTVVLVIAYLLFGTSIGEKIKNFIVKSAKASVNALKSAVRYVLGKSGAPKEVVDETEDFLDEATA